LLARQSNSNVLFAVLVGLMAHLVKRNVPSTFAFHGEVGGDLNSGVHPMWKIRAAALARARAAGVETVVTATDPRTRRPYGVEDADIPLGMTVRGLRNAGKWLNVVWGPVPDDPIPGDEEEGPAQEEDGAEEEKGA
jgi:hypothetical protein